MSEVERHLALLPERYTRATRPEDAEVHAADEPGLAHKIARSLGALRLDIVCARIATEKSDALDVFYVTDPEGEKLSESARRAAEEVLTEQLSPPTEQK